MRIVLFGKPEVVLDDTSLQMFETPLPWMIVVIGFIALRGQVSRKEIVATCFGSGRNAKVQASKALSGFGLKYELIEQLQDGFRLAPDVTCDLLELLDDLRMGRLESVRGRCVQPPVRLMSILRPKPWVLEERAKLELQLLDARLTQVETEISRHQRGHAQTYLAEARAFLDHLSSLEPSIAPMRLQRLEDRLRRAATALQEFNLGSHIPSMGRDVYDLKALSLLGKSQSYFDRGQFVECRKHCEEALKLKTSPENRVRALALIAWALLLTKSKNMAWRAVLRLQSELKNSEQLPPRAEALIWIQTGRYYNRLQYFDDAEREFAKVEELLKQVPQYEQERGALAAGKGYIAQNYGRLEEARDLYQLALERFSAAQWQWGMQVQYGNLAAIECRYYEVIVLSDESTAFKHLNRALEWCLQGISFMKEVGIGGLTDLETTLTFIYRMRKDWDKVREWLDKARAFAENSGSKSELGLVFAEEAELHEALGDRVKAIATFERAQESFTSAQAKEWSALVTGRLNSLKQSDLNSKPLKIW